MGLPKQRASSSPSSMAEEGRNSPQNVKKRANFLLNKLSDKDTEAMAAAELNSMAISLSSHSLSSFVAAVADTRSSDKPALRRHCLHLISLLSLSYPPHFLSPLLPRLVGSILRRLRDMDSAVRAACVVATRGVAAVVPVSEFRDVVLKPVSEALLLEQEQGAQTGAALCLAGAIQAARRNDNDDDDDDDYDGGLGGDVGRLIPRVVKLVRSDSCKAKAAVMGLLGDMVAVKGAATSATVGLVVRCLAEGLSSEEWGARKAAAEALTAVAADVAARRLLLGFKAEYYGFFESRKFDKVKIVREAINAMLEEWKDIPGPPNNSNDEQGKEGDGGRSSVSRNSPISSRKERSPTTDSPVARRKASPHKETRTSPSSFCRDPKRSPSDWKVEVAVPRARVSPALEKSEDQSQPDGVDSGDQERGENESLNVSKLEGRKILFEKNYEKRIRKVGVSKLVCKVVPEREEMNQDQIKVDEVKDCDLSVIRKQLLQIENQQMNLLDLVQKFIGSSQNGIQSLETRVQGLEMALEEISQDLTASNDRANHCCRIPKFWRRTESKYSQIVAPVSKSVSGQPECRDENS